MKTPRDLIHEAMRAASKRGCCNLPACAFGDETETMLCDELVSAIERRDAEHAIPEDAATVEAAVRAWRDAYPADASMPAGATYEAMRAAIRAINKLRTP